MNISIKNHPEKFRLFISLALILFFVFMALFAPVLSPHTNPEKPSIEKVVGRPSDLVPHPPDGETYLGTLPGQLDNFHIIVWGTRSAIYFGLITTVSSAAIGVLFGVISGYFRGRIGRLIIIGTEIFMAFPPIVGIVLISTFYLMSFTRTGPGPLVQWMIQFSITPVMLALILFSWMPYTKIIHSSFLVQIDQEYVKSAIVMGATPSRVIFRHILPNTFSPAAVLAFKSVGGMVILEAGLAFIGFSGGTDWGNLLVISRDWIMASGFKYWWVFIPITVVIVLFGVAWNMLGDQLSILFNPKLKTLKK